MAKGIIEVSEPVEFAIYGDRLQFTLVSGECRQTFAISFHRARAAAHMAVRLLDDAERANRIIRLKGRHG